MSRASDAALLADAVAAGPGAVAVGLLERIDPSVLDEGDRVSFMTAWQAVSAWATARSYAAMVPVVGPRELPSAESTGSPEVVCEESVVAEVAAACRLSTSAATDRVVTARFLAGPGAPVAALLGAGVWSFSHLRVVQCETAGLPARLAAAVIAEVAAASMPGADGTPSRLDGETPGRLRQRVRRTALRRDPAAATARIESRRRERSCRIGAEADFRSRLTVDGPHPMIRWAFAQFDAWARHRQTLLKGASPADRDHILGRCTCGSRPTLGGRRSGGRSGASGAGVGDGVTDRRGAGGHRSGEHDPVCPQHVDTSLEALRADAVIEAARLLAAALRDEHGLPETGAEAGADADAVPATSTRGRSWSQAVVVIDAPTLVGLADEPGWVPGYGWVPAPIARQLAANADSWRRFVTDHGRLVATGSTGYRPSDRLRELVTARDTVCTFPGCTIPSTATDLDHVANFDGANTTAANLHPACRRHHRIKTHGTWTAAVDPGGTGRIRWTSPTGHTYLQPPDPLWDTGPPANTPDTPWTLRYVAA
ncbi:MAG: DUF222 domain-containing protein [Candidatus Nanopelagicales bacterium]